MLCLKKKKFWGSSSSYGPQNQTRTYGLDQGGSGATSEDINRCGKRDPSKARDMAPPPTSAPAVHPVVREVTEDTPPDLLEGTMDLKVILPSGTIVQSTVERKTPMMDLLIHITTANKINPAGHIVQVRNDRGIEMPYKPSTPIGALDTTTIEIVPKNRVNEYIIVKKPAKVANQPFETTFRLQVHLPRNQLYVMRISPKTQLEAILREVCQEKNLDISKYEIRHPVNLDQKLSLSISVGETGLQELTVVSKNSKINSSVSAADIIALQQSDENRGKGCLDGSFKHSRSSVGDSSVSSESTGSGRGISPCRSEDSRSISPLPLIRPKTLMHSRPSYVSTCSSTGNSSGLLKSHSLDSSALSPISHQPVVMQAPPRTKKRAAPQPPSTPGAKVNTSNCCTPSNSNVCSPITEQYPSCSTPVNSSSLVKSGSDSVERVPRKKEAPREPPKYHAPLSHHQSLPLNHMRHSSGSNIPATCQQDLRQDHNDSNHADRSNPSAIGKMSNIHSISSSMTNLTSVSSVSSTSLASSTGGSKKRRAPKPPALAAVHPPTQIDEETTATDGETSSRGESDCISQQTVGQDQVEEVAQRLEQSTTEPMPVARVPEKKKIEVLSASPVSSLSSPSHSASESTSSSPIPPTSTEFISKSNSSVMRERSLNTNYNEGNGRGNPLTVEEYVESGSNIPNFSRSSSSPSSSNNNNAIAAASAPSPDSVRSRKLLSSSIAVDDAQSVVEDTSSCRPPSSNTQVTSSSPASQTMPMPLPRRRAPTAPDNASTNIPNNKQTGKSEQMVSEAQPSAHALPKPKPKPRADRISVESMISQTPGIIKPLTRSGTRQSTESSEDSLESETGKHPTLSGQLRNPLAKYGVKVLPDNVVKERENRLRNDAPLHSSDALEGAQNQPISHKVPIRASKSSSSDTTENFSDSGSVTSFSTHSIKKPPPGLSSKPVPTLSKSDYTNPGSIRSIKQLAASASSKSVDADNDDEKHYDSDNLEENLDMFEPANDDDSSLKKSVSSQRAVQKGKENVVAVKLPRRDETTKPPRVSSSVSAYEDLEKESSSDSPGASSESAFTRTASQREFKKAKQAEDASKLNRWQNMVSLNQIENTNGVGSNMSPSRSRNTNKPVVASAEVSTGSMGSSKQTLLHDDFQQSKNRLTVDENQTDAMCHSSESEASYTDSGVPATETVTPSPVNLDDVIPDHEYHSGTHQEKFSSEDAEDVRNSSRRSSLRSDHSEEWMNILEAKMNKDEEAIEKMFEAVLPQTGEELNGFESPIRVGDVAKKETEPSSDEHGFLHENDHILEDETHDTRTKEIETTVELHRPPASIPSEIEHSQMDSHVSASAVPVRKISKSESFSHNSEYDEAKQRRKNFYSARSNALNGSSQSSGSATDLRQSLNMSSSEEEGELSPIHSLAKNATSINRASNKTANSVHQHNHVRDDRAVSMSDLTRENYAAESAGRNASTNPTKTSSSDQNTKIVQKAMSLQKLSGDALDEGVAMDTYRKQLEMQFEQWKEEFMKTHVKTDENDESMKVEPQFQQVEQTSDSEVSKSELGKTVTEPIANEKESPKLRVELPQVILTGGSFSETSTDSDSKPALRSEPVQDTPREENLLKNKESDPDVINTTVNKEETGEPEMKDTEEFQKVELRKKKESPPQVIYQYSGPPTIKMASWTERPRRAVSVKKDDDYIMGFGQQDPNAKSLNAARIHSFHGGPVIPMAQLQADNDSPLKNNRESSPTPSVHVKGWSAALNATNATPNSTGAVRNVLSAWKQKMEETEMEKNKPKEGPPAEIDMYGSENTEKAQPKLITSIKKSEIVTNAPSNIKTAPKVNESLNDKQVKPVVVQVSSAVKPEPKILEKSKTLGSSFRTEKPMVFTMSSMDSNSNTLPKTRPVTIHNPSDVVDHKPSPATSTVEITSGSSLQERKKFFQGVSPVQNGKEAPIPATNLKSNIAVIQKVFEKQRTTKMQQMGSQQSLYSEGTISPSSSLQRNDSIDSRKSNINNFQRKNSVESHSSDSSSVILRVSQNTSGKSSPQFSSTEMVQKLFGRPNSNSFNLDPSRRTPSPISSTTSTLSSSTSYERFTPSPTVVDGPNNSVRITTGGYKPPNLQSSAVTPSIRSVGNKAIITVNGNDGAKNAKNDKKVERAPAANDIILEGGKISPKRPSVTSTYMTVIGQQQAANRVSVPAKSVSVVTKKMSVESVDSQKNASNGIPPPPPPPSAGLNFPSLSSEKLKSTPTASNSRSSNPMTPTTPTSPNPRDEIFNAIKNGNFGLKKTKSSNILLK